MAGKVSVGWQHTGQASHTTIHLWSQDLKAYTPLWGVVHFTFFHILLGKNQKFDTRVIKILAVTPTEFLSVNKNY